tara:strand:+ start:2842 stop:3210 length:369 start_codon:yes stop_codon:yes gene_type:complete
MAAASITFQKPINVSIQVGDLVFYTLTNVLNNFNVSTTGNNVVFVGEINSITETLSSVVISCDPGILPRSISNAFFMFRKNNVVNTDGIKGYFAEVTMLNNDSTNNRVELFATSAEVQESSK